MKFKNLILLVFIVIFGFSFEAFSQTSHLSKEIWRGKFYQEGLMKWEGKMELYIRYDPEESYPQKVTGLIMWPGLGKSKTEISGTRTRSTIEFTEDKCLGSNCGMNVLGGRYEAEFNRSGTVLEGTAELGGLGLTGKYKLKKVNTLD